MMKNIMTCLLAGLFIAVCPSISSALDFGITDISRLYADINWGALNTFSDLNTIENTTDPYSKDPQTGEESDKLLLPDDSSTGSDDYIEIGTGDQ